MLRGKDESHRESEKEKEMNCLSAKRLYRSHDGGLHRTQVVGAMVTRSMYFACHLSQRIADQYYIGSRRCIFTLVRISSHIDLNVGDCIIIIQKLP